MKRTISVVQTIEIEADESKFTPDFLENFNRYFHECPTVEDHLAYIARSYASGIVRSHRDFLEGYGILTENFGVKLSCVDVTCEIE